MKSKKGTTTVGVVCDEGVVLSADRRVSAGNLVVHKAFKKLYKITDNIGVSVAGMVSDNQMLITYLRAAMQKYEMRQRRKPTPKACSTYLAHMLYGNRFTWPFRARMLLAGYNEGPELYSLGGDGSRIEDDYVATGSGSPMAYGKLEDQYEEEMSLEDAEKLAVSAVRAAVSRDAFTGEGVDVMIFTDKKAEYKKV